MTMTEAVQVDEGGDDLTFRESDADAYFQTTGAPIKSFASLLDPVADEFKLRITEDGLDVSAVDPANVAMVDLSFHAEGFGRYETDEDFTFGLNPDRFQDGIRRARIRGGPDPVRVEVWRDPARMRVTILRPDHQMRLTREWFGIDPDSIRQEPDIPDLELPCRARPGVEALREGVEAMDDFDHAWMSGDAATFLVGTTPTRDVTPDESSAIGQLVEYPNCAWNINDPEDTDEYESLYSRDYLNDFTKALKSGKADSLTVKWGDEYPAKFDFEQTEHGIEGTYMVAPRIQSDD